jgi:hypothetical protein
MNHRLQSKETWNYLLKNKESLNILKESWKVDNPQKVYEKRIRKLSKNFSKRKNKE